MIKAMVGFGIAAAGGSLALRPLCGARGTAALSTMTAHSAVVAIATPAPSVVTLRITGMTCGGCVLGVRTVLTRLDGVTSAEVSYEKASTVVRFDSSRVTTAQMIAAIRTLGYTAVVAQ